LVIFLVIIDSILDTFIKSAASIFESLHFCLSTV